MQRSCQRLLPQWMAWSGRCEHSAATSVEQAAATSTRPRASLPACVLTEAQPRQRVNKPNSPGCSPTNSPGQALHDFAGGIQGAGRLPSGGEGGAEAKATLRRRLWKRQLRSHRSESAFGPGAGWHVQRCSSGREGGDGAPDAHGPSAEPPWWVWAGGGHERRRRVGLRMRRV